MKILAINAKQSGATPSFARKLKDEEKRAAKKDIEQGLRVLDKAMTIILPTNCSPSYANEDIGIGQPYSACSKEDLYPFLSNWGFSAQQRQPSGLGKQSDASPYVSNSSAYNTGIIDLFELTKKENGGLLSNETYNEIIKNNPKKGRSRSSYTYSVETTKMALKEAYETFVKKNNIIESINPKEQEAIKNLADEFEIFKKQHGKEQEKNALYNILTEIHQNDYWPNWENETDRNLFASPKSKKEEIKKEERLTELKIEYKDEIDSFLFSQMLAKKTLDEGQKVLIKNGIKAIGDIPVAFSDAEVWGNKDLFLEDLRMGCKEPWKDEPQRWGFFVLDPNQLFNQDGSLGKAGQFLYDKYLRAFSENKGGVRIDHIVGLMDPYVYNDKNLYQQGRLYSEMYKGTNGHNNDRILKQIVIPAANKVGLSASNIIAEDLGYMPPGTKQTLSSLGIGGISVTQWMNAHEVWNAPNYNAIMVSNHDTASAKELYPDKYERKNKFAELFSSGAKNIQIFWTDLFGIGERYNKPGVSGDENWSLRLKPDFIDTYHKRLEDNEAVNIPEAILEANRRRNPNFNRDYFELANSLQHWSNTLKEKE